MASNQKETNNIPELCCLNKIVKNAIVQEESDRGLPVLSIHPEKNILPYTLPHVLAFSKYFCPSGPEPIPGSHSLPYEHLLHRAALPTDCRCPQQLCSSL